MKKYEYLILNSGRDGCGHYVATEISATGRTSEKVTLGSSSDVDLIEISSLNRLGAKGWELVCPLMSVGGGGTVGFGIGIGSHIYGYLFKREMESTKKQ